MMSPRSARCNQVVCSLPRGPPTGTAQASRFRRWWVGWPKIVCYAAHGPERDKTKTDLTALVQLLGGGGVGVSGDGVVVSCPGAAGKRWNWRQPCRRRRDPKDRPPETYDVLGRFGRLRQVHPCTDRGHPTVYSFPQANQETSSIFFANSAQLGCRSGHDRVLFCQWYAGVLSRYMSIRAARSEASPPQSTVPSLH